MSTRHALQRPTLLFVALTLCATTWACGGDAPSYPATRRGDVVDDYFGTSVADPYRWLEDQNSPEVASWVDEQNAVTEAYLADIPLRDPFRDRLTELWNTPSVGVPEHVAGRLFYRMNTGLQNQSVLYGKSEGAEPLTIIDPNTLSSDGSVSLASADASPDGTYLAYGLSMGGSDWRELHVRDLAAEQELPDTVHWVKFGIPSWTKDGRGFFYTRFPAPPPDQVLTAPAVNGKIYHHVVGTPESDDRLVFERPDLPDWYEGAGVTDDGRYLLITLNHGTDPENLLYYADLGDPMHPNVGARVRPVNTSNDAEYVPLGNIGRTLFVRTTKDAPNRRIIALALPDTSLARARTVVPETENNIVASLIAGDRIVVQTLEDVQSHLRMYDARGTQVDEVALPGIGAVIPPLTGHAGEAELFYRFSSYLTPTTVYRYDFATRRSTEFSPLPRKELFDPSPFETKQVFYESKDGTRVPMFITARKNLTLDGSHPTILYAYGGFDIPTLPGYSPTVAVWLEHGGIYAVANIRGGSEYGEAWHHDGRLDKKQNVFDDFAWAGMYLIDQGYTSPEHLSIHGYSNGGLLVGVTEEQHPDLFAAAYPGAGVMDMLRYQKFSAGVGWVPEYGSSDDAAQFAYIYPYSPVHNVEPGTCYPATIVTTADHDDRVVPGHSYKFAAAMQAAQRCDNPVLLRVETQTSHGYMPTDKRIAQLTDIWAFTGWETGMR